jgi:PAS domain S-box-containing protein
MSEETIRILAVEDNPADYRLLVEHIKDAPSMAFDVVAARSLSEALERLSAERFSVVLLDLGLPDSSGFEGLEKITAIGNAPPVIVLTGLQDEEKGLTALAKKAQDYLVKGSITGSVLARSIRYAIERNRVEEDQRRTNAELASANEMLKSSSRAALNLMEDSLLARSQVEKASAELKAEVDERRHAEEDLRQTRDYLENLLKHANAPIIVWDRMHRILRFNKAFEHLTGIASGEAIGKDLEILFPKDSRTQTLKMIEETSAGENWESVEIPILRKDGRIRVALWNSANVYDRDGKTIISTIAQGQDITDRKTAEANVRHAAEEWSRTFDSISDFVFIQDNDFRIVKVNKALTDLLKERPQDIMGKRCYEVMHRLEGPWRTCPFEKTRKDKKAHTEEVIDSGLGIPLLVTTSPIFDERGEFLGSVHIAKDITDIKRAEGERERFLHTVQSLSTEAQKRATELANIISSVADPIMIYDTRGVIVNTNDALVQAIGFDPRDITVPGLISRATIVATDGTPLKPEDATSSRALQGEVVKDMEQAYRDSHGEEHVTLSSAAPIRVKGKISGAVVVWHDITERKRAEELRDRLIRDLSHQLKTPLSVIEMAADLLSKGDSGQVGRDEESIEMISRNTIEMKKLVSNILRLSSLESGKIQVENAGFDLAQTVREVIAQLKPLADEKGLRLTLSAPEKLELESDEGKLKESLRNLVENAIKYTEKGGIDVLALDRGDRFEVEVRDTGIGLTREQLKNLFTRFYKVDASVPGTGLGLNIARESMKLLGGTVSAESKGLGKGSIFKLTIPKERAPRT